MTIHEHNCETGEITVRELNAKELKQKVLDEADYAARQAEAEAKAVQRQAILDRLGLTADEAKLLLG